MAPTDPFLTDALGASRFAKDLLDKMRAPRYRDIDFGPAIYWAARCAAHWARKSRAWKERA